MKTKPFTFLLSIFLSPRDTKHPALAPQLKVLYCLFGQSRFRKQKMYGELCFSMLGDVSNSRVMLRKLFYFVTSSIGKNLVAPLKINSWINFARAVKKSLYNFLI